MSFRERLYRFWTRIRAWARLRRCCCLCGYGVVDGFPGYEPEAPERRSGIGDDGNRWRAWVHESCYDDAEPVEPG